MDELIKRENFLDSPQSEDAYRSIQGYVIKAQGQVYTAANAAMVTAYWKIGKSIFEACGENDRAAYGKQVYLTFPNVNALRSELSWTHYRSLMKVTDEKARTFYLEECAKSGWSSCQLERQINTMFYQRLLAGRDKESVAAEIQTTEPKPEYEQIIKAPYVLEFLDLPANEHFYESNLEQALIDLKTGILTHQDIGQMTLPEDNRQIYAAKYLPNLPTEEELKRELNLAEFEKLED